MVTWLQTEASWWKIMVQLNSTVLGDWGAEKRNREWEQSQREEAVTRHRH